MAYSEYTDPREVHEEVRPRHPMRVHLAVAKRFDWGQIGLEAEVAPPVPAGASRLAYNVRLGARFHFSDTLLGGLGVFTDRSSDLAPSAFWAEQIDYYGASVGMELQTPLGLTPSEDRDSETITLASTFALRYAYGTGTVGGLKLTADEVDADFAFVNAGVTVHDISLYVGASLRF